MNFSRLPAPFHRLISLIFYTAVCVPNSMRVEGALSRITLNERTLTQRRVIRVFGCQH